MIIDCHAHLEPRMLALDEVVRKIDAAGIDRVALIPSMCDPLPHTPAALLATIRTLMSHRVTRPVAELIHRSTLTAEGDLAFSGGRYQVYAAPDNDPVAQAIEAHPERFYGWIFLNPRNNPKALDELERWRSVPGMIGLKLHPHWHDYRVELAFPLLERCEQLGLPLMIHLGFRARGDIRAMAQRFPRLTIIAAHAGFPLFRDLWRHSHALRNVYVDLSSPYLDEKLARAAVVAMGADRCLFGTDSPYGFPESDGSYDWTAIRGWMDRLPVSTRERELIVGGTFRRILSDAGVG